jgi:hypothetical protein
VKTLFSFDLSAVLLGRHGFDGFVRVIEAYLD